ncbi:hypothetical protein ES288_D05G437800v1 [Gossypium darwinii]|uniref:Uncharacterized protein n=2 Tax=Gossypium TaxID=3633 RepID=A0A5D2CTA2_GOSDA|nr:hypothetical protein ES288_D05G437800v1 [Gossypium darwinii]
MGKIACHLVDINGRCREKWRALRSSIVKINFDVALNRQRKMSCSGVVIRNETGIVFGSKLVIHDNILTTFAAEIKGDAHSMVRKIQKEEDRSEIMPYIGDSKCLCVCLASFVVYKLF